MMNKNKFAKLLDANMSFVFLFCEEYYNETCTYEQWLNKYKTWLKDYTSPKKDIKKECKK